MDSRTYWRNREENARKKALADDLTRSLEVKGIYQNMTAQIDKDIQAFYQKYADKNGLSYAEAQKAVSTLDIKEYEAKAKYYVANRKNKHIAFSDRANKEMEIYNLTMKVNRLEMLKADIGLELVNGFSELGDYMASEIDEVALAEFKRQAGILGETINGNAKNAETLPDASYKQETFDVNGEAYTTFSTEGQNRIWSHYGQLKANLDGLLARALVNGESSAKLARELRDAMDVSEFNARRLIITETARVRVEVQKQTMEQNGTLYYEYMALGANPCSDCQDLDGRTFPVKDMQIGTNAPPMHPFCHCSTAPATNPNYNAWLEALANGETTEQFYNDDLYD